jgi:hypothetical protein
MPSRSKTGGEEERPGFHDPIPSGGYSQPPQFVAEGASGPAPTQADVALYIADLTAQMASMARAANLDLLAYFLAMAHAEARSALGDGGAPKGA